jgi:hypothetical protein
MKSIHFIRTIQFILAVIGFGIGVFFGLILFWVWTWRTGMFSFGHRETFWESVCDYALPWMPLILGAAFYLAVAWWNPKSKRVEKDICANCGYDLRATPDRCPECGVTRVGH